MEYRDGSEQTRFKSTPRAKGNEWPELAFVAVAAINASALDYNGLQYGVQLSDERVYCDSATQRGVYGAIDSPIERAAE